MRRARGWPTGLPKIITMLVCQCRHRRINRFDSRFLVRCVTLTGDWSQKKSAKISLIGTMETHTWSFTRSERNFPQN